MLAWGATDGWPKLDPDDLDESPRVTVTLDQSDGRTEMTLHVERRAGLSVEEAQELFAMGVREGWRDTVDRLAAELSRASA